MNTTLVEWVALGMIPRIGGIHFQSLLDVFGTPGAVLRASTEDLRTVSGIGPKLASAITSADIELVAEQLHLWQQQSIQVITWNDADYPQLLTDIDDRPPVLFATGTWQSTAIRHVAIVGTRNPSRPARLYTLQLSKLLASRGWTIVSGLALGIDTAAHTGALSVENAAYPTLGIVGCGADVVYPPENKILRSRILQRQGSIFSEVAPGTTPTSPLLVARNRLITGMSQAVVVIESGDPGGAMHAARFARLQMRPVWTVDFPEAAGNQRLKQEGCHVLSADFSDMEDFVESMEAQLMA